MSAASRISLIALGGNVGSVAETFAAALDRLSAASGLEVVAVSRTFLTEPVGSDAGETYLNAATAVSTSLAPAALLQVTKQIEVELGRDRRDPDASWTPRTLDLDLVTCGEVVLAGDGLRLPHPACWYRRFVLDPVCRIAAKLSHPTREITFAELRARLLPRPLPVWLEADPGAVSARSLAEAYPQIEWVTGPLAVADRGLALPANANVPDSLDDVLTAALGDVELAEEIPGWPERPLAGGT